MNDAVPQPEAKVRKKRARYPKHACIIRTYKFAMAVATPKQTRLFSTCDTTLDVRNRLVVLQNEEREANRLLKQQGREDEVEWLDKARMYKLVSEWAKAEHALAQVHSHILQDVVDRVEEGTKRWFDALRNGRAGVAPPRVKEARKYRSFTYKQYGNGCRIENHRVFLSGLGWFKIYDHRRMLGRPKTVTIKYAQGRWWCIVTTAVAANEWYGQHPSTAELPDVGGDPGLASLLTMSDGRVFDPPKPLKEAQGKLRRAGRTMSRKFNVREKLWTAAKAAGTEKRTLREVPLSRRLRRAIKRVAKVHTEVERVREYGHKKIASVLRDTAHRVAMEEHGVKFMLRNRRLARAASDRAIHAFKGHVQSAVGPHRYFTVPTVRPGIGGNSQTCVCSAPVPKALSERVHSCPACGLVAPRDMVSANIVEMVAFGTVSRELTAPAEAGRERLEHGMFPAGGQPVVMRGGDEGGSGESPAVEQTGSASESSVKRKSPASFLSMATPGVRKLPERPTVVHGRTGAAHGKARRAGMKPAPAGDSAARAEITMRNPATG